MGTRFVLRKQLRQHLDAQGLSAAELARRTGVAKSVISDWLAGAKPRDIVQVKIVANALGLTLEELCFDVEPKSNQGRSAVFGVPAVFQAAGGQWVNGIFDIRLRKILEPTEPVRNGQSADSSTISGGIETPSVEDESND
jgi:transcriptional regulator with XRE-family HTH domain